jgi:hypothetical protein
MARRVLLAPLALVVLLGGCFQAEEGPWTGSATGPVGGPCADDAYAPGAAVAFSVVSTSQDGFDLTTDELVTHCALDGRLAGEQPATVQVAGSVANSTLLRTFVYSGELTARDDMTGEVAFESTCTGSGCTTTTACGLTWSFTARESS